MPQYDLAGNPLSEPGPANPAVPPPGRGAPTPAPSSPSVRRDLAGNVLPESGPTAPPPGNWASPPPSGTWPPPPSGGNPYAPQQARNDSGEKAGVPPEIAAFKWNWGACGLTFLWCLNHRLVAAGLLVLIGSLVLSHFMGAFVYLISVPVYIYFGIMGHKLAWRNRHFPGGVPEFLAVQRAWMRWGVALTVIGFLFGIMGAILFPVFNQARMKARMMNSGYTQSSGGGGGVSGSGQ